MSLLATLNARRSLGSSSDTSPTDRLNPLVFVPGTRKTESSQRIQQGLHSFQHSEALGRSHKNQSAPRTDARTHRDENPYQSMETKGTRGSVQGASFISSVSSGDDQVSNPPVLISLRARVDCPGSHGSTRLLTHRMDWARCVLDAHSVEE
jgi:hypothetical protein